MKKAITFLVLFLFVVKLNSQTTNYPQLPYDISKIDFSFLDFEKFTFGLKVSPSINWVKVNHNDLQADGAALKFGIGGIADYEIVKNISVVSGVNYNNFGGYVFDNKSLNDPTTKDNYKLNYSQLEVPLCVKFKTTELNKMSYFIQGGLNSGFIIAATEKHQNINKNTTSKPIDIFTLTNPSSLGFQISIGTEIVISKNLKLISEICYKNALSNIALSDNYISSGRYSTPLEILPGSMEFSFGLLFN